MAANKKSPRKTQTSKRAAAVQGIRRQPNPPKLTAQRYHELLYALSEGVVMVSRDGAVIATNPSAETILGMTALEIEQALRDDHSWQAVQDDGKPFVAGNFPVRRALRTGKPQKNVLVGIRPGGSALRWLSVNTQPVLAPGDPKPVAVVASFEDVTRQRRVEAENARLASAVQASPDAITSAGLDQRFVSWSAGAERLFGYSAKEALAQKTDWLIPLAKREEIRALRKRVLDGETIVGWQTKRTRKDGQHIFVESSYAPIRDARGNITGTVGVHRDVSPIRLMLDQIKSNEELLRLSLNGVPDVFLIYDSTLRLQFVNQRGIEFFARPAADIIGRRDEELLPPEVTRELLPMLRLAHETRSTQTAELLISLRGQQMSITVTYVPMCGDGGEVKQVLGLLHDFTKRRQTEERLAFMAQYDSLTGLPNRYLLLDRLDAAMQRARAMKRCSA